MKKMFMSFALLSLISTNVLSQEDKNPLRASLSGSGGVVQGAQSGPLVKIGIDVKSGDFYKISGSLGRESHDYLTVGHIDAILKKNIPVGESKNAVLVLGYSPITIRSTSTLNATEALFKANVGLDLTSTNTSLIYSLSPLSSISDRESKDIYKAIVHGVGLEQDIGNILKITSVAKFANNSDIQYLSSQTKLEVPIASRFVIYGFYEVDKLKVAEGVDDSQRNMVTKSSLSTLGVGVKIGITTLRQ